MISAYISVPGDHHSGDVGQPYEKEEVIKGAQRLVCSADTPDQDDFAVYVGQGSI